MQALARIAPDPCPACDAELPAECAAAAPVTDLSHGLLCPACGCRLVPMKMAASWRRTVAALGDLALVCLPIAPLNAAIFNWAANQAPTNAVSPIAALIDVLVGDVSLGLLRWTPTLLAIAGYYVVFHTLASQTPLQKRMGLRVVDGQGNPLTPMRALARALAMGVHVFSFGLGLVWSFFDTHGRTWHDWIAGTYVVRAP